MTPERAAAPEYRQARPDDAEACIDLRGRTRENAFSREELRNLGITPETWRDGIAEGLFPGYVFTSGGRIGGYCFGDSDSGEILVLAVLPDFEGSGVGRTLLGLMVEDFRKRGFHRLFLGAATDPGVRSHGFYRHLGWVPTGGIDDAGDEIMELTLA
ncbi:MAG: GNAT family N-acetyltransferase [Telmatospirillum sp.]|nr:GNAT family N-acetyltransferase [Telmatospirillum sp.]